LNISFSSINFITEATLQVTVCARGKDGSSVSKNEKPSDRDHRPTLRLVRFYYEIIIQETRAKSNPHFAQSYSHFVKKSVIAYKRGKTHPLDFCIELSIFQRKSAIEPEITLRTVQVQARRAFPALYGLCNANKPGASLFRACRSPGQHLQTFGAKKMKKRNYGH